LTEVKVIAGVKCAGMIQNTRKGLKSSHEYAVISFEEKTREAARLQVQNRSVGENIDILAGAVL
jgi:hypothetical protein